MRLFSGDGLTGLPPRRTKGVIHDRGARYLEIDEALTVGSQEAMFLTLGGTGPRRPFVAGAGPPTCTRTRWEPLYTSAGFRTKDYLAGSRLRPAHRSRTPT